MSSLARSTVHGVPSSLLNEPGGATTSPSGASTAATRSFVEVLPDEPVMPMIVSPPATSSVATAAASLRQSGEHCGARAVGVVFENAGSVSVPASVRGATTIAGTPTGRAANTATAPAATAAAAKS